MFSHFTYLVLLHNLAKQETQKTMHWNIVRTTQSNFCSALDFVYPEPWAPNSPEMSALITRFWESYSSVSMSRESNDWRNQAAGWNLNSGNALIQQLSEKCNFRVFLFWPGTTETQVIWGDIIKCLLIAYFLGNISAKNIKVRSHVLEL